MKLITFSLWGQDPKYLIGAIKNAKLAKKIYPDWVCRFYVGQSVPFSVVHELKKMKNVQVVEKKDFGDWKSMFWRFEPASEKNIEVMISRDTDSRLNMREKKAVDEWLKSDKGFHIMRDHPWHKFPILGGMWGAKNNTIKNMKSLINNWNGQDKYGTDYEFFSAKIMPLLNDKNTFVHDEFYGGNNFPTSRENYEFVGQVFDENEETVKEHVEVLRKYYENR